MIALCVIREVLFETCYETELRSSRELWLPSQPGPLHPPDPQELFCASPERLDAPKL